MSRIQWKSRRTFGLLLVIVFYLLVRIRNYDYKASVVLHKIEPIQVWEFVADFSNMKYLNPTIISFNILDESGDYKHWKYSIEYTETLSHWPYTTNVAIAKFDIKSHRENGYYLIHSIHRTCFLSGLYCLDSESDFKFMQNNSPKGTTCEETINYQCPAFMSSFCRREVEYQRKAIMNNLHRKFTGLPASAGNIHTE